jgi:hypothetical protein
MPSAIQQCVAEFMASIPVIKYHASHVALSLTVPVTDWVTPLKAPGEPVAVACEVEQLIRITDPAAASGFVDYPTQLQHSPPAWFEGVVNERDDWLGEDDAVLIVDIPNQRVDRASGSNTYEDPDEYVVVVAFALCGLRRCAWILAVYMDSAIVAQPSGRTTTIMSSRFWGSKS